MGLAQIDFQEDTTDAGCKRHSEQGEDVLAGRRYIRNMQLIILVALILFWIIVGLVVVQIWP